jgi:hypothetical protein
MLNEARTVADIIDRILSEYDVDRLQCEGDIIRLLNNLAEHGLVEINDDTAD